MYPLNRPRRYYRAVRFAIAWWFQRRWRGWDDRDIWALDTAIATFALPRLRYFRNHLTSFPPDMTFEEWREILSTIIYAMEVTRNNGRGCHPADIDWKRAKEGFILLGEHFTELWD